MTPSHSLIRTRAQWLGTSIRCYVRDMRGEKLGPFDGTVKGVSDNEVASQDEGRKTFSATGLLVDIPELGRNPTYGQWPINFSDVITSSE